MLVLRQLQQACTQHHHRARSVLDLAALVLHGHHDAGGLVRDAHRRVGGVDALATRPAAAVHVDGEILVIDLHLDFLRLGQHQHRCRRGVDATLAFGDRHPLHTVGAALELEPAPRGVAVDHHRDLIDAAEIAVVVVQDLHRPALGGGECPVHVVKVASEKVCLLAALGASDLHDDCAAVVGVFGQQQ